MGGPVDRIQRVSAWGSEAEIALLPIHQGPEVPHQSGHEPCGPKGALNIASCAVHGCTVCAGYSVVHKFHQHVTLAHFLVVSFELLYFNLCSYMYM